MAFSDLNVSLGLRLDNFNRGIKSAQRSLRRFSRQTKNLGRDLSTNLTAPLGLVGVAALKSFGEIERFEKALFSLEGTAEGAGQRLRELNQIAQAPGIGLEQALSAELRLRNVGFAAEQVNAILRETANENSRLGGGLQEFDRAIIAFQQLSTSGKITQEDLNQLRDSIPTAGKALREAFGSDRAEDLRKLGVTGTEAVQTIIQAFAEQERVAGGFSNALQNLGNTARNSLAEVGRVIDEQFGITGRLEQAATVITNLANAFSNASPEFQRFAVIAAGIAAAIGPALFIFGQLVGVVSQVVGSFKLLTPLIAALASPVGLVVTGLTALGLVLFEVYKRSEPFRRSVDGILSVLGRLVSAITSSIPAIARIVGDVFLQIFGAVRDIGGAVLNLFSVLVGALSELSSAFGLSFDDIGDVLFQFLRINEGIVRASIALITALIKEIAAAVSGLANIGDALLNGDLSRAGDLALQAFESSNPVALFRRIGTQVADGFSAGYEDGIAATIQDAFDNGIDRGLTLPDFSSLFAQAQGATLDFNTDFSNVQGGGSTGGGTQQDGPSVAQPDFNVFREVLPIVQQLGAAILGVNEQANALGETLTNNSQTSLALADSVQQMGEAAGDAGTSFQQLQKIQEGWRNVSVAIISRVGDAFLELASGTADAATVIVRAILDIVNALITQAVIAAVAAGAASGATGGPAAAFLVPALIAATVGTVFSLISNAFSSAPKLAEGGLAFGPTLAVVGDNLNASSDPEVIAPLSKLEGILNRGDGERQLVARIGFDELVFALERENQQLYNSRP